MNDKLGGGISGKRDDDLKDDNEAIARKNAKRRGSLTSKVRFEDAPRWVQEHPELYNEMAENNVPMNGREFLAQGYRLIKEKNGDMRVLYPTWRYQLWMKNGGDPNDPLTQGNQPHYHHHETLEEKKRGIEEMNNDIYGEDYAFEMKFHKDKNRIALEASRKGYERENEKTFRKRVEETLKKHNDEIIQNPQKYYLLGQKAWLASTDGSLKPNQFGEMADGLIAELSETDHENYSKFKNYQSVKEATAGMIRFYLGNQEFNEQEKHQLKHKALIEFIEEDQKFGKYGKVECGAVVGRHEWPHYERLDGLSVLKEMGFHEYGQELEEIIETARKTVANHTNFTHDRHGNLKLQADDVAETYYKIFRYHIDFESFNTLAYSLAYNKTTRDQVAENGRRGYKNQQSICGLELVKGNSWKKAKQIDMDWKKHQEALALTDSIKRAEPYGARWFSSQKLVAQIVSQIETILDESLDVESSDEERRAAVASGFQDALDRLSSQDEDGHMHFFHPISWLKQNREQLKLLAGEDYDENNLNASARKAAEKYFHISDYMAKAIPETISKYILDNHSDDAAKIAATSAIKEYLDLMRPTKESAKLLATREAKAYAKAYDSPLLVNNLDPDLRNSIIKQFDKIRDQERREKMPEVIKQIQTGAYYYDPHPDGDWWDTHRDVRFLDPEAMVRDFRDLTDDLPKENAEIHKQHMRRMSYEGLINILNLTELTVDGYEYENGRQHHGAESHANKYYHAFGYANHIDELNDFITMRVTELENKGDEYQARRILRLYKKWIKNPEISQDFEAYRKEVKERQKREREQLKEAQRAESENTRKSNRVQIYENTPVSSVRDAIAKILLNKENYGDRFVYKGQNGVRQSVGDDERDTEEYFMPAEVALERINALQQWENFFKEYLPDSDVSEAAMIFSPKYKTLSEAINHLDGNVYSVITFNYAGKRCMIAECAGISETSGTVSGAMKVWCGDIANRDGWKEIFDNHSKTTASQEGVCKSINHYNLTLDVENRETDDLSHIVDAEDVMFRLALRYFQTGDESLLRNNTESRRKITEFIGPQQERPNPS